MARLPTKEVLGPLPSARTGRPIASFDESAIGKGVAALGKGVAAAGEGIGHYLQVEQEREDDSWFIKARADAGEYWAKGMATAKVEAGEGAPGFVEGVRNGYDKYTKTVLDSAPSDRARELYSRWATVYGSKIHSDAIGFATKAGVDLRDSRYKEAFEARKRTVYSNPGELRRSVTEASDDLLGMEKDLPPDLLLKHRERLKKDLTEAAIMGLAAKGDFDSARALTGLGGYADRVIAAESSGRPDAKADTSTAAGLAGFTEETWIGWFNKAYPGEKGLSREAKLALRSDRKYTGKVLAAYNNESRRRLGKAGIPTTPMTLYAEHFFGHAGGVKVLKASDDTPIGEVVAPEVVKANPKLKGKTVGEVKSWLASRIGDVSGDIPLKDAVRLRSAIDRAEAAHEKKLDTELRTKTVVEGYDLMRDRKLTTEWLTDHKDDIELSDYKVFSRALTEDGTQPPKPKITDPKEYIRLLDLADSDPEEAIKEVKDAYGNNKIAKDVFNRVFSRASGNMSEDKRKPSYVRQMRSYLNSFLGAEARRRDGSKTALARHLDSMFVFDDYVKAHPEINRADLRKFTEDLIGNYKQVSLKVRKEYLPLPSMLTVPRENLTMEHIRLATGVLAARFRAGNISKAEMQKEAKTLLEWTRILNEGSSGETK